jgi:hypothetical protein
MSGPKLLTYGSLEDFSVGAAWKLLHDEYLFRGADRPESLSAQCDELGFVSVVTVIQLHHGGNRLSPVWVGCPDHSAVPDGGMLPDDLFNVGRVDVEATRDDHVLLPVCKMKVAIRIQVA